jgi:tripartite-type tricarboxylate transporter receptor subunit TctC
MRRQLAALSVLALLVTAGCAEKGGASETGGNYPTKPIQLLVGFDAGGPTDSGARLIAKELEKKLDATVTVVNRPGANSQIAYTALTKAKPDGYTMAAVTFPSAIVTVLDKSRKASFDQDSFEPVALQVVDPTAVAVAPDSDIKTPEDLIAAAKADPGKLRATTTGVGSQEHFALARLKEAIGADIAPVHFAEGTAPATTAFLGGNVEFLLGNVSDMQPLVESKKVRVVGVMEAKRSPFLPDVPTFKESGFDVEISSSRGFAFPAGTPKEVVAKVSDAIGEIMKESKVQDQMKGLGLAPTYMDSKQYSTYWDETSDLFADLLPLVQKEK